MRADEALLIKLHDTDHSVAWRAPHTSFRDITVTGDHSMHSAARGGIEVASGLMAANGTADLSVSTTQFTA